MYNPSIYMCVHRELIQLKIHIAHINIEMLHMKIHVIHIMSQLKNVYGEYMT